MIHILGCAHWLQGQLASESFWCQVLNTRTAQNQLEAFVQRIENVLMARDIGFIGEEARHGLETPAAAIARRVGCGYANVDMPEDMRKTRGIPTDYADHPDKYGEEQVRQWHRDREEFMMSQLMAERPDAIPTLLICGADHVGPLFEYLRARGEDVSAEDITKSEWYLGPPTSDWLFQ